MVDWLRSVLDLLESRTRKLASDPGVEPRVARGAARLNEYNAFHRQILNLLVIHSPGLPYEPAATLLGVVKKLAAVHAEMPGYRQEWRP